MPSVATALPGATRAVADGPPGFDVSSTTTPAPASAAPAMNPTVPRVA